MTNIYDLQQRADVLRKKTATDSISPEEVGGLHADTLAYIANMERYASSLGIKKVYTSVSEMNGDESPVSSTGMPLKAGQLVTIFNAEAPDAENSGEIYAFQNPGWVLVGRLDASNMEYYKKINSLPTTLSFLQYEETVAEEGAYFTNTTYTFNTQKGVYELKEDSTEPKLYIPVASSTTPGLFDIKDFKMLHSLPGTIVNDIYIARKPDSIYIEITGNQIDVEGTYYGGFENEFNIETVDDKHAGLMSVEDKKKLNALTPLTYIDHGTSDTSVEIGAFEYHRWGEVSQILVNIPNEPTTDEGVVNVYMLEFISGSTATKIAWPLHIKPSTNTIEANKTYQITIINNLASVKSFT